MARCLQRNVVFRPTYKTDLINAACYNNPLACFSNPRTSVAQREHRACQRASDASARMHTMCFNSKQNLCMFEGEQEGSVSAGIILECRQAKNQQLQTHTTTLYEAQSHDPSSCLVSSRHNITLRFRDAFTAAMRVQRWQGNLQPFRIQIDLRHVLRVSFTHETVPSKEPLCTAALAEAGARASHWKPYQALTVYATTTCHLALQAHAKSVRMCTTFHTI